MSAFLPRLNEWAHFVTNGERHANRIGGRIGTREGIVEIDEQAVPGKVIERRPESRDELDDDRVILAKHGNHLFGLHCFREGSEATQIAEDRGDFAAVALEETRLATRDHEVDDLRREKTLQPTDPLQILNLLPHSRFERVVELRQFVLKLLDAEQRPHAGEQLGLVERLLDEVVRPGFKGVDLLMVAAGSDHDHREEPGGRVVTQSSANLITVHLWHHDVQQYEVRILAAGFGQASLPEEAGRTTYPRGERTASRSLMFWVSRRR